jgi:hypothetical protein
MRPNGADLAPEYVYFRAFRDEPSLQGQFVRGGAPGGKDCDILRLEKRICLACCRNEKVRCGTDSSFT